MSKRGFITLALGVVGGLIFAIGMCMCLIIEWNSFEQGRIVTAVGLVVLLGLLVYRLKTRTTPFKKPSKKALQVTALSIAGALALGVGMCMTMVFDMMVPGIIVGIVGIVLLLLLIPLIKGIHD